MYRVRMVLVEKQVPPLRCAPVGMTIPWGLMPPVEMTLLRGLVRVMEPQILRLRPCGASLRMTPMVETKLSVAMALLKEPAASSAWWV
jgi:hypothetical protein